ncbi:hypothetical protein OOT46_11175 [Aquabacterium sp. A7-Y]|uniref:hypothetical protein n=1 Tax=Aquabacterium sp. A7-Y TaxID=1349605 RepID=UPI00223D0BA9|nr:hypothetical protein [Aquabacterium sp. A7-Y]MCW7538401.1 hypothetical protein [Aquabacterium sp. A7-Y]
MKHVWLLVPLLVAPLAGSAQSVNPVWGTPVTIKADTPPRGAQIVQLFLENATLPLKGTGCSHGGENETRTLREALALVLGDGLDQPHYKTVLSGSCKTEVLEAAPGKPAPAWACSLHTVDSDRKGGVVASASIRAGFTKDSWTLIPGSLICL